ncbi:MAG TPA: T9SS type A sorting domain-containing protein, partial [Rubricoccaceae bacterium]
TPGGNGIVAIQYYSGINPADGLPFTSAPTPTATSGFASARVALYGDQGFMSTVYRTSGGAGGPAFGAGNLTVFFGPRGEQVLGQTYDGAGWRQLTHGPGSAMDVADLAEQNLVQGITNEYPTATAGTNGSNDNLFTEYDFANAATATDPAGFRPPAARATALTGGKGLFWYFYDSEFDPTGSQATNGTGSSESFTLPNPLLTAGTRRTANVTTTIDATTDGAFRFEMLGNPFEGNFDMTTLTGTGGTPSTVAQTYSPTSPTTGTYVLSSTVGNRVALWQGFFLDVGTGTTAVTFPIAGVTTTATPFQGFGAPAPEAVAATTENRLVAFELSGQTPDGTPTVDQAAAVYFSDAASEAWDRFDAGKLAPFGPYAVLAIQGERDGQAVLKSQESRAYNAASFEVPLVVEAAGTEPALTLRWNQIENVPAEWALTLRDLVTGDVVNLRTATEYTFEVAAVASAATSASVLLPPTPTVLGVDAGRGTDVARFVLHVETAAVTATEDGAPAEFALAAPAPNPTAGAAVVSFDVPEASAVSVAVYDLLGRRVAVLAEGEMAAGRHTSRLEAGTLAPGVYVVRMQAGTFSAVRRVTVVR